MVSSNLKHILSFLRLHQKLKLTFALFRREKKIAELSEWVAKLLHPWLQTPTRMAPFNTTSKSPRKLRIQLWLQFIVLKLIRNSWNLVTWKWQRKLCRRKLLQNNNKSLLGTNHRFRYRKSNKLRHPCDMSGRRNRSSLRWRRRWWMFRHLTMRNTSGKPCALSLVRV